MRHRFQLRQKSPIVISEIASSLTDTGEGDVRRALQRAIKRHYDRYGNEPFRLQYDRRCGDVVVANSVIGLCDCGDFDLEIVPKFSGLEIGKCLQLAHQCGFSSLVQHNSTVVDEKISDISKLSGIDYFAQAFLGSLLDVIGNGLSFVPGVTAGPDSKLRGRIDFSANVAKACKPTAPYTIRQSRDINTPENRILVTAIQLCIEKCTRGDLKAIAANAQLEFESVLPLSPSEQMSFNTEFSYPRPDYERAMNLASIVIEGFDPTKGEAEGFSPYFTIDLDKLFEAYVGKLIRELIVEPFKVSLQLSLPHLVEPELASKTIIPDIVVSSADVPCIVLDTKNKYSLTSANTALSIENADIFQMYYYAKTLGVSCVILVYPGDESTYTKFPIFGSEGKEKYLEKKNKAIVKLRSDSDCYLKLFPNTESVDFFFWRVNLSGTIADTKHSLVQLCAFVLELSAAGLSTAVVE